MCCSVIFPTTPQNRHSLVPRSAARLCVRGSPFAVGWPSDYLALPCSRLVMPGPRQRRAPTLVIVGVAVSLPVSANTAEERSSGDHLARGFGVLYQLNHWFVVVIGWRSQQDAILVLTAPESTDHQRLELGK